MASATMLASLVGVHPEPSAGKTALMGTALVLMVTASKVLRIQETTTSGLPKLSAKQSLALMAVKFVELTNTTKNASGAIRVTNTAVVIPSAQIQWQLTAPQDA